MVIYARRTDENQTLIMAYLRKQGATVQSLSKVGQGVPDLLVGFMGVNILFEIKDGSQPPSKRRLTEDQVNWLDGWAGKAYVICSVEQAAKVLKSIHDSKKRARRIMTPGVEQIGA